MVEDKSICNLKIHFKWQTNRIQMQTPMLPQLVPKANHQWAPNSLGTHSSASCV